MPYMGTKSSFFDIRILYWDRERDREWERERERSWWRGISVAISVSYHYKREMSSLRL